MPRGAHTAIRGLLQHQARPACPGTSCTAVEICSPWHAQSKVHPQRVGHVAGSWRDDLHVLSIHLSTGISKDSTGAWVSFKRSKRQREFSNPTVTFVVEKKKSVFMPAKSLSLRIGRVFLALVRTLPLKGTDAAPAALVLQWALKLKFPSALLFGSAEHF